MLYLSLIGLPLALALGNRVASEQRWSGAVASGLVAAVGLGIVLWTPLAAPATWLGATLQLSPFNGMLLACWLVMLVGAVAASLIGSAGSTPATTLLLMTAGLSAALLVPQRPLLCLLLVVVMVIGSLLLMGGSAAVLPPLRLRRTILPALTLQYIVVTVLGAVCLVAIFGLVGPGMSGTRTGLVLAGLGMWVILLPALLLFAGVVEHISLPTLGVVVGGLPALAGMLICGVVAPDTRAALSIALLALVPGATCLLIPASPRRLLVVVLITDSCLLLPGLLLGTALGLRGALLGSVVHALALVLVVIGMAAIEQEIERSSQRSYVSVLVVVFGLLILVGAPPLPGWYARVASWSAARDAGMFASLLFGAGQILLIAGAVRLALALLRDKPLLVANTPALRQRGGQQVRMVLFALLAVAALSGFAVDPLLKRVDAALSERASLQSFRIMS